MANQPVFCPDIIYEIMSRTPIKSLDRFKTVSKEINDLTHEPSFMPLHGSRTGTITGYFIQNIVRSKSWSKFVSGDGPEENPDRVSLDFLPCRVQILASSNQGIVCCYGEERGNEKFFICKPSTRQWRAMPSPKMRYFTLKVAILVLKSRPLRYKIVRISDSRPRMTNNTNYRCEVFDSDTWKWKELDQILLPSMVFFNNKWGLVSSVAYGVAHWLLSDYRILAFHFGREVYETFDPPLAIVHDTYDYFKNKQILACKGKLKFFCQAPEGYMMMWEMKNYLNHEWGEMKILNIGPVEGITSFTCPDVYNDDAALLEEFSRIKIFNFWDASCREVKIRSFRAQIFPFRSDKEPVQFSTRCLGESEDSSKV